MIRNGVPFPLCSRCVPLDWEATKRRGPGEVAARLPPLKLLHGLLLDDAVLRVLLVPLPSTNRWSTVLLFQILQHTSVRWPDTPFGSPSSSPKSLDATRLPPPPTHPPSMSPSPLLLFSTLCLSASAASAGSVDYAPSSPSSLVTAAQAAEMAQHSYNELYPTTLNLSLLLGLGAFLLFVSPLVASWLASGRFLQGWMLGGRKRRKVAEEEWGMGLQRIMSAGVVVPAKVKIVSGWYAK